MRRLSIAIAFPSILLGLIGLYLLFGGNVSHKRADERARLARLATASDPVQVAVVWPSTSEGASFIHGIRVAASEINEAGGVLGRKVVLRLFKEEPGVAREIAKDVNTIAVIGYSRSGPVLQHAVTYNTEKMVFIMPFATDPNLTLKDFLYSFRTIPDDNLFAEWLARQSLLHLGQIANVSSNEIAIMILAAQTDYGTRFAQSFGKIAGRMKALDGPAGSTNATFLRVLKAKMYPEDTVSFLPVIEELGAYPFDVLMIADELPRAGHLIRELRDTGMNRTIIASPSLDSPALWNIASNRAFGVYFPSTFAWPVENFDDTNSPMLASLLERYAKGHGGAPDFEAAQGYEALHLLAQAVIRAGSSVPQVVATVMEHVDVWRGLFEVYPEFHRDELVRSNIFLKFLASNDYPSEFSELQPFVQRDLAARSYTNTPQFRGYFLSLDTNRVVPIEKKKYY